MKFSQETTQKRKNNYLKSRYLYFEKYYGKIIKDLTKNEILESIVYAIIIYEDFNRPKITRYIENLKFRLTKKQHSLGVMQVNSDKLINDLESVKLGTQKIINAYKKYLKINKDNNDNNFDWYAKYYIINDYNVGSSYSIEVNDLADFIQNSFYLNTTDTLCPKNK